MTFVKVRFRLKFICFSLSTWKQFRLSAFGVSYHWLCQIQSITAKGPNNHSFFITELQVQCKQMFIAGRLSSF